MCFQVKRSFAILLGLLFSIRLQAGCEDLLIKIDPAGVRHARESLASFVSTSEPWTDISANSEQRNPFYLGANPREMVFEGKKAARPVLRETVKAIGEEQAKEILK